MFNARLTSSEQPGAHDAEDAGDEEPGAALRGAGAAGQRGEKEGNGQSGEDVLCRQADATAMAFEAETCLTSSPSP